MDLLNIRAVEVTKLAMDGLLERQKAIASNTANSMTDGYQRKDVAFEDQLRDIISKDEIRKEIRMQNSLNPISANAAQKLTREHAIFLNQRDYSENFKPEILGDYSDSGYGSGNNVDIEEEMINKAKTGTQYQIMSSLESKMLTNISRVIQGGQ